MEDISSNDLKTILHSKRANVFYLEYCRVMQKDGRVLYLTEAEKSNQYFNIPIANTTVILLGNGTSITQAAVRMLAKAGVLVGFSGGGGTPLYMGNDIEWMTPQGEYRPTEYLQGWVAFWFDDNKRLEAAKILQQQRMEFLQRAWSKDRELKNYGFDSENLTLQNAFSNTLVKMNQSTSVGDLLLHEAQLTKALYKFAANALKLDYFSRSHDSGDNKANYFLNHGNYLAYGLSASTLWVLGIPHGFAVMHGKTRRGALVFDVADLIKDALVLPWAFICAAENESEQGFRQQVLQSFTQHKALDFQFNTIKDLALGMEASLP